MIQVEALFFPYCVVNGKTYARLTDTPCKGWDELHAWVRSWGVPDTWPMGTPKDFVGRRNEKTWETTAGWYRHADVPENNHQGLGSWPAFATMEDDMTPAQEAMLKQLVTDVAALKKNSARASWTYGNPDQDAASLKATGKHIPDMHGRIEAVQKDIAAITKALTALVKKG